MPVQMNHVIMKAHDRRKSAHFLADILGLPEIESFAEDHFLILRLSNNSSLDIMRVDAPYDMEHYAFQVTEPEFDEVFARVKAKGIDYFADPFLQIKGTINTLDGGRAVYFVEPGGHNIEVLTKRYGSETEAIALTNEKERPGKFPGE